MVEIGYTLSSEELGARDLVRNAARAEEVGFTFAVISDHFHPWTDTQGNSPFVWSVLGGISQVTERLQLGTGVTCPLIRIHPAIIAQAVATVASMMQGRFFLGVGTGEYLNEHILGDKWPTTSDRRDMLEEAIQLMRELWKGELTSHRGDYYVVENARIYTLPEEMPKIMIAGSGPKSAELAGRLGDGFINTKPVKEPVEQFRAAGGAGKPTYGQIHVCWAQSEQEAVDTAVKFWPNAALKGNLGQELALPSYFEQAIEMVSPEDVAKAVICGPDPEKHLSQIHKFMDAGFDHIYVHQVGHDQEGFLKFYEREILPQFKESGQTLKTAV